MNIREKLTEKRGVHCRMTRQRRIIHEELSKLKTHPTADELHKIVKVKIPSISLGTVYRNLEMLSGCGVIRKLELGLSQRRYDGDISEHHHIKCLECGKVGDIPREALDICRDMLKDVCGYKVLTVEVGFVGICPQCQNK